VAKFFVFLQITDPEINALITGIRAVANGAAPKTLPHVTIRGPYNRSVPPEQIRRYNHLLSSHPLVLDGIGMFKTETHITVYLKVQHPKLLQIWWKPDYPTKRYGFNPHVTLYDGPNLDRGTRLREFLQLERLKLLTWKFAIVPHASDHTDMFQRMKESADLFLDLVNKRAVRPDILARLSWFLDSPNRHGGSQLSNAAAR
jgi:hypothetical protein